MNRDIEFRGLTGSVRGDIWVYGTPYKVESLFSADERYYIRKQHEDERIVDPKTIGQYTGLKDKNGKKIFEGDIIRLDDDYRKSISSCDAKTEEELVRKDCLVGFKDGSFMFCRNRYVIDDFDSYLWISNKYCEVIGNIYENKELLEV